MKTVLAALVAVGALGATFLAPTPAQAVFFGGPALEAPSLVETVQCRTRTVRTRGAGGRVVVRTVRSCSRAPVVRRSVRIGPGFRGCRTVQTRTRGPGGRVVVRSVRRC